jgi:hypothetical protein
MANLYEPLVWCTCALRGGLCGPCHSRGVGAHALSSFAANDSPVPLAIKTRDFNESC